MKLILYIIWLQVCVKNPNGIFFKKIRSLSELLFKRFKYPTLSQAKLGSSKAKTKHYSQFNTSFPNKSHLIESKYHCLSIDPHSVSQFLFLGINSLRILCLNNCSSIYNKEGAVLSFVLTRLYYQEFALATKGWLSQGIPTTRPPTAV